MRFLCLHGQGANAEIFESQTAGLRYALRNDQHEFIFVEGSMPCDAAPGVKTSFPEQVEFAQFFDEREETLRTAVEELEQLLNEEDPPFEGIIGFSQGATLAATLVANQAQNLLHFPKLKVAVFICCIHLPLDGLHKRFFDPERDGDRVIQIPTLHVFGHDDPCYKASLKASRLCDPEARKTYDHRGGHEIPRTEQVSNAIADGLRKCLQQALTIH